MRLTNKEMLMAKIETESEELVLKFNLKPSDAKRLKNIAKIMEMSKDDYVKFIVMRNIGGTL